MKRTNPEGLTQPTSYHHLVEDERSGLIFTTGQVGIDENGDPVAHDVRGQFIEILRHFDVILDSLGLGREAFVKVTIFTEDVRSFYELGHPPCISIFEEYFRDNPPAATLVGVTSLARPEFKIEVEAVLTRPQDGERSGKAILGREGE